MSCLLLGCMLNDKGGVLCMVYEWKIHKRTCAVLWWLMTVLSMGYMTVAETKYCPCILSLGQPTCPLSEIKKQCNQKVIACIGGKQMRLLTSITSSYSLIVILVSSWGVENCALQGARLRVILVRDISTADWFSNTPSTSGSTGGIISNNWSQCSQRHPSAVHQSSLCFQRAAPWKQLYLQQPPTYHDSRDLLATQDENVPT